MKTKKIILAISLIIGFLLSFMSCKKDTATLEVPYLFRPVGFAVSLTKTVATITWNPIDSATSYTLQISKDSLSFTNIIETDSLTTNSYTIELAGNTRYSARVKANASDPKKDSKYNQTLTFKTPPENIFLGYSSAMTDQGTATINWLPAANATKLVFSASGKSDISLDISASEKVTGSKVCASIPNGSYAVKIYNNDILRGTVNVLLEGDYFLSGGSGLLSTLTAITKDSAVVVLKPGVYSIGTAAYTIPKNIKIRGLDSINLPIICMQGAAAGLNMLTLPTTSLNFVRFENIEFSGYTDGTTTGSSGGVKSNYLFNQSGACSVGEILFKNCVIRNIGNTPFRLQSTTGTKAIGALTFSGCRIWDIGNVSIYAIVNNNVATATINNITFKNSSIYNFGGSLIVHTPNASSSVSVINCTFNQINANTTNSSLRYFIDYGASGTVTNGVVVRNSIFGSTPTAWTEGIRVSSASTKTISGSYYTNDFKDNNATTGSVSIMGSLSAYSGASTALFTDPINGNFKFKDTGFAGRLTAGDPRWFLNQ
ncbi:MAG: DUF5123 domain-containing protein [Bacteroidota bacterium]|nr:DUF5123 domain-containing protein [Bacteroidota bacterium]